MRRFAGETLRSRARRCWPQVLLLAALTVCLWAPRHSTAKPGASPIAAYGTPDLALAAFVPALDVVPASNGTDLYLSVAGAANANGTLFANVAIGPGGDKGSYTMTYSPTTQLHVVTVAGFNANVGTTGTIDITTTNGLATPLVSYNRARIQPMDTNTIFSTDGRLELTPVSPDTFSVVTYVAIVPDFAPRAPAPPGHRLVGQTYRVRASGNSPTSARPMFLDISFSEADLAGADPHTLGLFGWDDTNGQWQDLGGQRSSPRPGGPGTRSLGFWR